MKTRDLIAGDAERDAFRWIARYERDSWQMAYSGRSSELVRNAG